MTKLLSLTKTEKPENRIFNLDCDEEMKVICFFAPATSVDNYLIFEEIEFPESKEDS